MEILQRRKRKCKVKSHFEKSSNGYEMTRRMWKRNSIDTKRNEVKEYRHEMNSSKYGKVAFCYSED